MGKMMFTVEAKDIDSEVIRKQVRAILNYLVMAKPGLIVKTVTSKQVVSGYHRPVCPKCNCEFRPEKNGVGVLDMADFGPCDLYDTDLWKCPVCGAQVIGGFGNSAISSHFQEDFQTMIASYESQDLLVRNNG